MGALDELLAPADQARVVAAVKHAEQSTSGQIKVHVEARCVGDPFERAKRLFVALGLEKTRARNGVLLYLAVRDRRFAILGDVGIHEAVGAPFWEEAVAAMRAAFVRGAFGDGLCDGIAAIGGRLAERFPRVADGANELSDEISTSSDEERR